MLKRKTRNNSITSSVIDFSLSAISRAVSDQHLFSCSLVEWKVCNYSDFSLNKCCANKQMTTIKKLLFLLFQFHEVEWKQLHEKLRWNVNNKWIFLSTFLRWKLIFLLTCVLSRSRSRQNWERSITIKLFMIWIAYFSLFLFSQFSTLRKRIFYIKFMRKRERERANDKQTLVDPKANDWAKSKSLNEFWNLLSINLIVLHKKNIN